jgi:CRP-like cAMP-binding protein
MCKNLAYEKFEMGDVILEEGAESNDKMYVIIAGEVAIVKQMNVNVFLKEN